MESMGSHDLRRSRKPGGNGRPAAAIEQEPSIGELFRQLSTDSSHLVRLELNLAKTELRETGSHLGQAAARLGAAIAVALPGLLAVTAFLVIGLGDLIDNYWASALIVGVALLGIGAFMAKRAVASVKEGGIGIPETAGTLREDAQWAKEEAGAFKRQFTA